MSAAQPANAFQIHPVARQVGSMGTYNCLCLRPYAFLQLVITQNTLFIAGQNRQADAPVFHQIKRPKHGIVLQYRGNHMDDRGQAFRGITGKCNLQGIAQVKQFRNPLPGFINHPGRIQGSLMGPSAGIAEIPHGVRHCINDTVRLPHGSSCIVKINHNSASLSHLINREIPITIRSRPTFIHGAGHLLAYTLISVHELNHFLMLHALFLHKPCHLFFHVRFAAPGKAAARGYFPGHRYHPS